MRKVNTKALRELVRVFGKAQGQITNAQLYRIMELQDAEEKGRLRMLMHNLVQSGEVIRLSTGVYEYNFDHRPRINSAFVNIWRLVRKNPPGWSINNICMMSDFSYPTVAKYCNWLKKQGYISKYGKKGNKILYYATLKADQTPETPFPNYHDNDLFEKEREAAVKIAHFMFCHDPYATKTGREISAACKILLERFAKNSAENENEKKKRWIMYSDEVRSISAALGMLAGKIGNQEWEYIRKAKDNLNALADNLEHLEGVLVIEEIPEQGKKNGQKD